MHFVQSSIKRSVLLKMLGVESNSRDLCKQCKAYEGRRNTHDHGYVYDIFVESAVPEGRASDYKSKGPGFDPHTGHHVVSMSKTH